MELGIIKKEIVCSVKEESINGIKIFFVRPLKLDMSEKEDYIVSVDNELSLGIGDIVLFTKGSASRQVRETRKSPLTVLYRQRSNMSISKQV
jgi:microcompartment protein CcmK/EutM